MKRELREVKRLMLFAKRSAKGLLDGLWASRYRGRGMAFEELATYQPGDSISDISWTHLAAWNRALVKKYREERDLKVWIVVDISASTVALGQRRRERIAEMGSLIALAALLGRDRVGLLFFSDRLERLTPPKRGVASAPRLLEELLHLKALGQKTDWRIPFSHLSSIDPQGGSLLFLLSDFATLPPEELLLKGRKRHQIFGIWVREPLEEVALPRAVLRLLDAESGESCLVNLGSEKLREANLKFQREREEELRRRFGRAKSPLLTLSAHEGALESLTSFLRRRRG